MRNRQMQSGLRRQVATLVGVAVLLTVPLAAQDVLTVVNERVGIGTENPLVALHISQAGPSKSLYEDRDLGITWSFSQQNQGFVISKLGSGGNEFNITTVGGVNMAKNTFQLAPNGNLTLAGTLTENSSRAAKRAFEAVNSRAVLAKVAELPLFEWNYRHDPESIRHFGPVAEDFHRAFGLGRGPSGLSTLDTSGVALAAIQGLNELVVERDEEIRELRNQIADLAIRLETIEAGAN